MNKLYTLLLILSVFVSCKMQNNAGYEIISSHFGENTRGFNISEIMDSVRYVKIDDSIPIGEIQDIQLGKDNIYLTDNSKILVLSYDGCIRHIVEHRGRAKNEYISMSSFSVHPTSGDISVYDDAANKVVVYDSTGNHLKTFSVDRFREFLSVEDGYYMYRNDIEHGSLSGLWHVDLNGGSLCRILTLDDSFVYHCFSKGYLSRVSDDITGLLGREDSNYIYHINNANKSVEEKYKIDYGVKIPRKAVRLTASGFGAFSGTLFTSSSYSETSGILTFSAYDGETPMRVFYDKTCGRTYIINDGADYTNDMNFLWNFQIYSSRDGIMVSSISAGAASKCQHIKEKYPHISYNSNPVIVLAYMKP